MAGKEVRRTGSRGTVDRVLVARVGTLRDVVAGEAERETIGLGDAMEEIGRARNLLSVRALFPVGQQVPILRADAVRVSGWVQLADVLAAAVFNQTRVRSTWRGQRKIITSFHPSPVTRHPSPLLNLT